MDTAKAFFPKMVLEELDAGHWGASATRVRSVSLAADYPLARSVHSERYVLFLTASRLLSLTSDQYSPNEFKALVTNFIKSN